ncbi:hypothetical protein [Sphingomonas sp. UYP23]
MTDIAQTAAGYFERYQAALATGALKQGVWNSEQDGRHVACALGVLGDKVSSASQCPATVMPRWLAQMVPWLFDNQAEDKALAWGLDFAAELKRLNGGVPFSVVYDWQGNVACQMGIDAAEKRGRDTASHVALQDLHRRALKGDIAPADEWRPILRDAYANAYADANAYAYANANANANAYADAINRLAVGLVECLSRVPA